jgi:hypothetical protein
MALLLAPLRWLTSSIIRLAIFAAVLVVAYLVLLKPALHSADEKVQSGERSFERTLHSLEGHVGARRLAHCVEQAGGDIHKLERCATKL